MKPPTTIVPEPITRRTFTIPEAAVIVGVGKSTMYEHVKNGDVPCVRLGRRVVIPAHVIESMLSTAKDQLRHFGSAGPVQSV
jgi:excisionase family DNA binding protein